MSLPVLVALATLAALVAFLPLLLLFFSEELDFDFDSGFDFDFFFSLCLFFLDLSSDFLLSFFLFLLLLGALAPPASLPVCVATDGALYVGVFLLMDACAISANCSVGLTTFRGRLFVFAALPPKALRLSSTIFDFVLHGADLPTECLKCSTQGCVLMAMADLYKLSIVR